jgi:hypothetical protein
MRQYKSSNTSNHPLTSRVNSSRSIFHRVSTPDNRISSPQSQRNISLVNKHEKAPKVCVRYSSRRKNEPVPHFEPPYLFMRNGVPFLYTPNDTLPKRNSTISPFGTPLRGFKIKCRYDHGNMFAVHSAERLEITKPIMLRSYLNNRSKWK